MSSKSEKSELIKGLEASGLKPIVIDENTDFSKLTEQFNERLAHGAKMSDEMLRETATSEEIQRKLEERLRRDSNDGYVSKEAFCLMWYQCDQRPEYTLRRVPGAELRLSNRTGCGHRERIWNSRDGVTPFSTSCPSCGGTMNHVDWHLDQRAPDYTPHPGQKVWISMTLERADEIANKRMIMMKNHPDPEWRKVYVEMSDQEMARHRAAARDSIYKNGEAPDMKILQWNEEWKK